MIPHTFVLEPGLKIFKIYNGYWYWGRPTITELHMDCGQSFSGFDRISTWRPQD
jgi:hypothetical protein